MSISGTHAPASTRGLDSSHRVIIDASSIIGDFGVVNWGKQFDWGKQLGGATVDGNYFASRMQSFSIYVGVADPRRPPQSQR